MKKEYYAGIDPGQSGAVAFIDRNSDFIESHLCPATPQEMDEIIKRFPSDDLFACLELAHAFPKQGVSGVFNYGKNFGIWIGILAANKIPYEIISPQKWCKLIGAQKGESKTKAWEFAQRRWFESKLKLKKHQAIAEALVIAEFGRLLKGG